MVIFILPFYFQFVFAKGLLCCGSCVFRLCCGTEVVLRVAICVRHLNFPARRRYRPRTFQEGPVPGDNLHNPDFKLPNYAAYGEILNPPLKTGSQNPKSQGRGREVQKRWGGREVELFGHLQPR